MPICQQPARRIAPVAAGDQLELAEVGRDRHESERRVDGCLVAGEVCAQLGRSGQRLWRWSGGTTVQANGNCGVVGRLAEHSVIGLAFAPTRHTDRISASATEAPHAERAHSRFAPRLQDGCSLEVQVGTESLTRAPRVSAFQSDDGADGHQHDGRSKTAVMCRDRWWWRDDRSWWHSGVLHTERGGHCIGRRGRGSAHDDDATERPGCREGRAEHHWASAAIRRRGTKLEPTGSDPLTTERGSVASCETKLLARHAAIVAKAMVPSDSPSHGGLRI